MVNKVLPHTHVDLVSYSAWDSATEHYADPNVLRQALDFIAANTPDSPDFGNRNVYLGEFGMPENVYTLDQIRTAIPNAVRTGLDWGCPYIVYWQLYCNELKDPQGQAPGQEQRRWSEASGSSAPTAPSPGSGTTSTTCSTNHRAGSPTRSPG